MNTNPLQQFRDTVYRALPKRADATLDLLDALTSSHQVTSPVALSSSKEARITLEQVAETAIRLQLGNTTHIEQQMTRSGLQAYYSRNKGSRAPCGGFFGCRAHG